MPFKGDNNFGNLLLKMSDFVRVQDVEKVRHCQAGEVTVHPNAKAQRVVGLFWFSGRLELTSHPEGSG